METARWRDPSQFTTRALLHLHVALCIIFAHPSVALYLNFNSNSPLTYDASLVSRDGSGHETLSWAVKVQHPSHRKTVNRTEVDALADVIAEKLRLKNYGQVGELIGHYLFVADSYHEALNGSMHWDLVGEIRSRTEDALTRQPSIEWFNQQTIRRRYKREVSFEDPSYPNQWHLHNAKNVGMDINVTGIWEHNITGAGVTVAVIDDGLEWENEDISDNYCAEGSWDLNSNDNNPTPERRKKDGKETQNRHGTRCAGEIAAVRNNLCGVGVSFNAKVSGIRLLDGPMTDSLEATAFNKFMYINDIYSCSWGPDDDGKTVDGPHTLAKAALQHGVTYGRRGRGSIFVVASGNGGKNGDNCNYDGYANSMYTVTIGAVDEKGQMPFYAEECASLFAVTYSSGSRPQRNIVTTDWTLGTGTGCTNTHTGTSAAAPLAAGMISLMLEAKPCLSWRDVQHIIVFTASKIDDKKGEWTENAAGFHHSHKHGFGVLKAWRLVNAAKVWLSVPWLTSISSLPLKVQKEIPTVQEVNYLIVEYEVTNSTVLANELFTMEHVLITLTLSHTIRGKLRIELICPSGTRSVIGARRKKDTSRDGLRGWTFSTVRCWGEEAVGVWQLIITDFSSVGGGVLEDWKIDIYGSNMKPENVKERKDLVERSYGGEFLDANLTEPCSFYWASPIEEEVYLSLKTIKLLLLVSGFATILALYYSLEQAFCTEDEKRKQAEESAPNGKERSGSIGDEHSGLLSEAQDIAMEDLDSVTPTLEVSATRDVVTCEPVSPANQQRQTVAGGDAGGGLEVELTYTCVMPVCIGPDFEEKEDEEEEEKEVGGEKPQGIVQSGDLGRNHSSGASTVDAQPVTTRVPAAATMDSLEPQLIPTVLHASHADSANQGKVLGVDNHSERTSETLLVNFDSVPVNQPITANITDRLPSDSQACNKQGLSLVPLHVGMSDQPIKSLNPFSVTPDLHKAKAHSSMSPVRGSCNSEQLFSRNVAHTSNKLLLSTPNDHTLLEPSRDELIDQLGIVNKQDSKSQLDPWSAEACIDRKIDSDLPTFASFPASFDVNAHVSGQTDIPTPNSSLDATDSASDIRDRTPPFLIQR